MGIGGSLLDAMKGAEYADQRINAGQDRERQVKLNAMTDEVNTGRLEDYRRERGDTAAMRDSAAGSTSISEAADKQAGTALERGRVDLAQGAKGTKVADLANDVKATELEFAQKYLPVIQKMQQRTADKQAGRMGDLETLDDQKIRNQMEQDREVLLAKVAKLMVTDQKEAARVISDSPVLFPGQKISGFLESQDGKDIAIVGANNEKVAEFSKDYVRGLLKKYADPGKFSVVKPGETVVHEAANGDVTPKYSQPALDSYAPLPENSPGTFNKHTGAPGPGTRTGPGGMSPQRQDARFKVAENVIASALGGQFNALGKLELPKGAEAIYQRATVMAEEAIKRGVDPARAASDAVKAAQHAATTDRVTAPPGGATSPGLDSVDWSNFVTP